MANPFVFGKIALGAHFTNRGREIAQVIEAVAAGQDVFIASPRRFGKTSLVLEAVRRLRDDEVLVAYADLFAISSPDRFLALLTHAYFEGLLSAVERTQWRLGELFSHLPVQPQLTVNPMDGSTGITLGPAARLPEMFDALLAALLDIPADVARRRKRRVALVLDEFQDVVDLDPTLPRRLRSAFQQQPDVAHLYLGSRQSLMRQLFTERNQPFYQSARHIPIGPIVPDEFARFIRERFASTAIRVDDDAIAEVLAITGGQPHDTQKLCAFLWDEAVAEGHRHATRALVGRALDTLLDAEDAGYAHLWRGLNRAERLVMEALADEEGGAIYSEAYRLRHHLGAASTVQRAIASLARGEFVERTDRAGWRIQETFLRHWVRRQFPAL